MVVKVSNLCNLWKGGIGWNGMVDRIQIQFLLMNLLRERAMRWYFTFTEATKSLSRNQDSLSYLGSQSRNDLIISMADTWSTSIENTGIGPHCILSHQLDHFRVLFINPKFNLNFSEKIFFLRGVGLTYKRNSPMIHGKLWNTGLSKLRRIIYFEENITLTDQVGWQLCA